MTAFTILAGALSVGIVLVVRASRRDWPPSPAWRAGLRLGILIALIRLAVLWAVFLWPSETAAWLQVLAYAALVLNTIVELALASVWLDNQELWQGVLSVLVLLTSLILGQVIAYLAWWMQKPLRGAV